METLSLSEKNKTLVWVKRERKKTDTNIQQLHRAESEGSNFTFTFSSPWKDSSPYWQLAPSDRYLHVPVWALPLLTFLEQNLEVTQQWRADPPLCPHPHCNNASCQSQWLTSSWLHHCPSNGPPGTSRSSKKKRASIWKKKKKSSQRAWGRVFLCLGIKGSLMREIMRPGHPSATSRLEMRDLISSLNHWGFPEWAKEKRGGGRELRGGLRQSGEWVEGSQNVFTLLRLSSYASSCSSVCPKCSPAERVLFWQLDSFCLLLAATSIRALSVSMRTTV